jgi:hypothetical protein
MPRAQYLVWSARTVRTANKNRSHESHALHAAGHVVIEGKGPGCAAEHGVVSMQCNCEVSPRGIIYSTKIARLCLAPCLALALIH